MSNIELLKKSKIFKDVNTNISAKNQFANKSKANKTNTGIIQRSAFSVQRSVFSVQCSVFSVQFEKGRKLLVTGNW